MLVREHGKGPRSSIGQTLGPFLTSVTQLANPSSTYPDPISLVQALSSVTPPGLGPLGQITSSLVTMTSPIHDQSKRLLELLDTLEHLQAYTFIPQPLYQPLIEPIRFLG